jgi:formylglycine-generating enzyme required for sulfatase activity
MRKAVKNALDRVLRGGSYLDDARHLRTAIRNGFEPEFRYGVIGFRLVARKVS